MAVAVRSKEPHSMEDSGPFSERLGGHFNGSWGVDREFLEFICGPRLGAGMSREVFRYRIDPKYVIKIELEEFTFQNVAEMETWDNVKFSPLAKWFAPIKAISGCGRFMLQQYAEPLASIALPAEMPAFFTDFKPGNYGRIGKQVVAVDYGRNLLSQTGLTKRMRKADWS